MIATATLLATLRACLEPRAEILEAYLFGSAATGSAQAHSDVDVAVYLREPRPPASPFGYVADLTTALMRGLGVDRVDVVVLNDANPLERVPGEPVLRVPMGRRDGQLLGPVGIAGPGAEYVSYARDLLLAPRGTERLFRLRQRQVIDQAQSISRSQRLYFMLAVGVEHRKLDLVATLGSGKIDALLLALVAYDELASFVVAF